MSHDDKDINRRVGDGADDTPTSFIPPQNGGGDAPLNEEAWSRVNESIYNLSRSERGEGRPYDDSQDYADDKHSDWAVESGEETRYVYEAPDAVEQQDVAPAAPDEPGGYPTVTPPAEYGAPEGEGDEPDSDEEYFEEDGTTEPEQVNWKRNFIAACAVGGIALIAAVGFGVAWSNSTAESATYANQAASNSAESMSKDRAIRNAESERDKANADVKRLTKERDEARKKIGDVNKDASELRSKVAALEKERGDNAQKDANIKRVNDALRDKQGEVTRLEGDVARLNKELDEARRAADSKPAVTTTTTTTVQAPSQPAQTVTTTVQAPPVTITQTVSAPAPAGNTGGGEPAEY